MTEFDIVYNKHCCRCHLRHEASCNYANCSKEQYAEWLKEAREEAKNDQK